MDVAARLVVIGGAKFRRSLRDAEERAAEHRRWRGAMALREDRAAQRGAARAAARAGHLLRQAEALRALIARVREAVVAGSVGVDDDTLAAWERWASAEADRLDPILSGQIRNHLAPTDEGG